jgi:hypothetical protein
MYLLSICAICMYIVYVWCVYVSVSGERGVKDP